MAEAEKKEVPAKLWEGYKMAKSMPPAVYRRGYFYKKAELTRKQIETLGDDIGFRHITAANKKP